MKLNEDDICNLLKAVTWYRDMITGSDYMWDKYDKLNRKLEAYGEEVTTDEKLNCQYF